jgi:hypothetical protein
MKRLSALAALVVVAVLAACTSYSPTGLPPGSTEAAAIKDMGQPTAQSPLPDGGKRLEFDRGPLGYHTYMLDFDAQGRLQRWDQVLTEENFAKIQAGMDKSEVQALIGHPSDVEGYGYPKLLHAWSYRYWNPSCLWFQVGMTTEGKVVDSAYATDPICERRNSRD